MIEYVGIAWIMRVSYLIIGRTYQVMSDGYLYLIFHESQFKTLFFPCAHCRRIHVRHLGPCYSGQCSVSATDKTGSWIFSSWKKKFLNAQYFTCCVFGDTITINDIGLIVPDYSDLVDSGSIQNGKHIHVFVVLLQIIISLTDSQGRELNSIDPYKNSVW